MSILFSDNFTRANSTDLGANYTPNSFDGAPAGLGISSDFCLPVNGGGTLDASNVCTAVGTQNDGYALVTLAGSGSGGLGNGMGVTWRDTTASLTHYRLVGNSVGWELAKLISGTYTLIQNSAATTFAGGDSLQLSFVGTAWTVSKNGTSIASGTDSSISSGAPGIGFSSTDTSLVDYYEVGTVSGGATGSTRRKAMSGGLENMGGGFVTRTRHQLDDLVNTLGRKSRILLPA